MAGNTWCAGDDMGGGRLRASEMRRVHFASVEDAVGGPGADRSRGQGFDGDVVDPWTGRDRGVYLTSGTRAR
jgi:hypothetical protein